MTAKTPLAAVYPGTFDPMTLGHEDLMRRAAGLFDRLIVAVAAGHHKRTMFDLDERLDIAREIARPYPNVEIIPFHGLLRDDQFLTPVMRRGFTSLGRPVVLVVGARERRLSHRVRVDRAPVVIERRHVACR